jgi:hypothetical protein
MPRAKTGSRSISVRGIEFGRTFLPAQDYLKTVDNLVVQVGVGGLFAILVLREVRAMVGEFRIGRRNGNGPGSRGSSGEKSPEFWQSEMRKAAVEAFAMTATPALTQQTELLREIRDGQRRLSEEVLKMAAQRSAGKGART